MAYLDKYDTPLEAGQVKTGQSVLVGHGHKAFLIWDPTISQVRIDVGYRGVLGARTSRNNPCRGKGGERAYKTHNIWQNLGNSVPFTSIYRKYIEIQRMRAFAVLHFLDKCRCSPKTT